MGLNRYLEDLISKSEDFQHFLEEFNKDISNEKKLNIQEILAFRQKCELMLSKIQKLKIENLLEDYLKLGSEKRKS